MAPPQIGTRSAPPKSKSSPFPQSAKNGFATVRVFYGTDRNRTGSDEPKEFYGTERDAISIGFCDVSIPKNHITGELESPKIWKFEFTENPRRHVVLLNVEPVDGNVFLNELRCTIQESIAEDDYGQSIGGEALLFVHGYNVSFEDAARRTAQIAYDIGFHGAPMMYSWPSKAELGFESYKADGESAQWSQENVSKFLAAIAKESGARKIHLIAHSMGNRVLTGALKLLPQQDAPVFNEVVLTAPDIDADVFKNEIAPKIVNQADRVTIYASANDVALRASSIVNTLGKVRLGQGGRRLTTFPDFGNIHVIDASDVDTSLFAFKHSYHADSETVLHDISGVLQGQAPRIRKLQTLKENLAWRIHATKANRISGGVTPDRQ